MMAHGYKHGKNLGKHELHRTEQRLRNMEYDHIYNQQTDTMDDFELRFGAYEPKQRSNTYYSNPAQDAWDIVQDRMYADIEYV